ncbi:ADYC domain-containing protein [Nannocystis punicea]|uniref:ADYC domain-containing protein n=1 Tax=Nannocystis punicea TaxID=2995304 RepID=A0ABY7HDE6_9BACT|nr:ADYC domain-containing protein [Nannocystis poenicansa]WAS97320.1 ADYC domain-containing protein [Nannocystis poenicansa]
MREPTTAIMQRGQESKMTLTRGISVVACVCSLASCDGVADLADPAVELREQVGNGMALNTAVLNGMRMNGMRMNGMRMNGMRMNGINLNGINLNGLSLTGSSLSATGLVNGALQLFTGAQLVGAVIDLDIDGEPWKLRFDDIYKNPAAPTSDVWFYDISIQAPGDPGWESLCFDHLGQPTQAIPLANHWDLTTGARIVDPGVVTFACRDAVLAKCVEWGYRPWATAGSTSLANHHQACTRMARADYCGDGTPHTFTGTPIDVLDKLSPRIQAAATLSRSNWGPEAEWGPSGAVCVGDMMRLKLLDDAGVPYAYPACLDALDDFSSCGSLPGSRGGLLANRFCDKWGDQPQQCASHDDDGDDDEDDEDD